MWKVYYLIQKGNSVTDLVNYIPKEILDEANKFIYYLSADVDIYKTVRKFESMKPCIEADKFTAYWDFAGYNRYPHALITLYENMDEISNSYDVVNAENPTVRMQQRMNGYYLLLKENNLIGE